MQKERGISLFYCSSGTPTDCLYISPMIIIIMIILSLEFIRWAGIFFRNIYDA